MGNNLSFIMFYNWTNQIKQKWLIQSQSKKSSGKIFSWGLGWDGMEGDQDVKLKPHKNKEKEKKETKRECDCFIFNFN